MESDVALKHLVKRLDVLISLELEKPLSEKQVPMADRIVRLRAFGLSASEIASILGKPTNYVTAALSQKQRIQQKKGGRKP